MILGLNLTGDQGLNRLPCHKKMAALVIDETTLAQINGEYPLPPDAGPAWRAACEAGVDMSLVEGALKLTPEERLAEHQQVIDFLLEVQAVGEAHAAK